MPDPLETVLAYHAATKHQPQRYANGPGYLDWDNQPDPFRRFEGADAVLLPFAPDLAHPSMDDLRDGVTPAALTLESVSQLFERSLALSAWKEFGDKRWALRCNPSSGNLHPTEGYVALPALAGLSDTPAVFHYRSVDHALERRCEMPADAWPAVTRGLPEGAFVLGLSSVVWREAWKYGERAFRYCQHDVGHALAALRYAAATLGWTAWLASQASDEDVRGMLGLDRDADFAGAEHEHPDVLAIVCPRGGDRDAIAQWPDDAAVAAARTGTWHGRARKLSAEVVHWNAIAAVTPAVDKAARSAYEPPTADRAWTRLGGDTHDAVTLIRQRRSAVDFDGKTTLSLARFFRILDRAMPRSEGPPLDVFDGTPAVHLVIFVHRVEGMEPGL
ncbi:MAG: nitroreductase, partial [Deltaproteobacteria bacterium]